MGQNLGNPRTDTLQTVPKPQPECPVTCSIPFQPFGTTRVLKVRFRPFFAIFGPFWSFLAFLGQTLGHLPYRHTPNCAKTLSRMSCNLFHAIPTIWDHQSSQSQILAIFGLFLDHFGPFWALLDQNWGDFRTPNWVKTSTRTFCNLFHTVPTVLDHQSAPARALKPTRIIGHKNGHFG